MKRKTLRLFAFIFVLLALSVSTYAATESSLYLSYYNAFISKSGNTIQINFDVQGTRKMDTIGATEIYLYERADSSSSWTLVQTFLSTDPAYTSSMLSNNTAFKYDYVSYTGNASYQYKAYVTVYAEKDGGSDSRGIIAY